MRGGRDGLKFLLGRPANMGRYDDRGIAVAVSFKSRRLPRPSGMGDHRLDAESRGIDARLVCWLFVGNVVELVEFVRSPALPGI